MIQHSKPSISAADLSAVESVLKAGLIAQGDQTRKFEKKVCDYLGCTNAIATSSGKAALILALHALEIRAGDEVVLPTYVCESVVEAILIMKAIPIFCDTGPLWNMTPETVAPHITDKTKAIIVVHIYGIAVDTEKFLDFDVPIIEDCCQAFGAKYKNKMVGSIGTLAFFSFHATKCLTTGEGGMLVSNNDKLLEKLKVKIQNYSVTMQMSDLQAALGISQLNQYQQMLEKRREIANYYFQHLPKELVENMRLVVNDTIFFRFVLNVTADFDLLRERFYKLGIHVRRGVDKLLHQIYPSEAVYPNAEKLFQTSLSIPIYPSLTSEEYAAITQAVLEILYD